MPTLLVRWNEKSEFWQTTEATTQAHCQFIIIYIFGLNCYFRPNIVYSVTRSFILFWLILSAHTISYHSTVFLSSTDTSFFPLVAYIYIYIYIIPLNAYNFKIFKKFFLKCIICFFWNTLCKKIHLKCIIFVLKSLLKKKIFLKCIICSFWNTLCWKIHSKMYYICSGKFIPNFFWKMFSENIFVEFQNVCFKTFLKKNIKKG